MRCHPQFISLPAKAIARKRDADPYDRREVQLDRSVTCDLPFRIALSAIQLLAGPPRSRKSGLAFQLALDRGERGLRSLVLLNEESPGRVADRAHRLLAGRSGDAVEAALGAVRLERAAGDAAGMWGQVEQLVLRRGAPHRGADLVVLDSIQGGGVSAGSDAAACAAAVAVAQRLQALGIATLLIGHVTKTNAVRGPRSLEHAVDVVLHLDRRGGGRTLTVPKNRFGPAVLRPVPLRIDPVTTRLVPAPHAAGAQVTTVRAFDPHVGTLEVQAAAALPPAGHRGRLGTCRGLPRAEVQYASGCLGRLSGFDTVLPELDLSVASQRLGADHGPLGDEGKGGTSSGVNVHLPVCIALAGAALGLAVPPDVVAIGELDLAGRLRHPSPDAMRNLEAALRDGALAGTRLICPASATRYLPWNCGCQLHGVDSLDKALRRTWPGTNFASLAS
jgi:DNA repair protein RadA/Sms